jgi:hypothetical protein
VITLFLIPCLYIVLEDFGQWWREAWAYVLPKKSGKTELHPGAVHSDAPLAAKSSET